MNKHLVGLVVLGMSSSALTPRARAQSAAGQLDVMLAHQHGAGHDHGVPAEPSLEDSIRRLKDRRAGDADQRMAELDKAIFDAHDLILTDEVNLQIMQERVSRELRLLRSEADAKHVDISKVSDSTLMEWAGVVASRGTPDADLRAFVTEMTRRPPELHNTALMLDFIGYKLGEIKTTAAQIKERQVALDQAARLRAGMLDRRPDSLGGLKKTLAALDRRISGLANGGEGYQDKNKAIWEAQSAELASAKDEALAAVRRGLQAAGVALSDEKVVELGQDIYYGFDLQPEMESLRSKLPETAYADIHSMIRRVGWTTTRRNTDALHISAIDKNIRRASDMREDCLKALARSKN